MTSCRPVASIDSFLDKAFVAVIVCGVDEHGSSHNKPDDQYGD